MKDSDDEVLLYTEEDGPTSVHIRAYISESHALVVHGQDMGEAVESTFGSDDYEYLVSISRDDVPALRAELANRLRDAGGQPKESATTTELVATMFGGRSDAVSRIRDLCAQAKIPSESFSWP